MVKAMSIAVMIFLGLIAPLTTNAQSDGFFRYNEDLYNDRDANINIWTANNGFQHDDFGAPLGTGLLILTAAGAGYAISRRKRNFKNGTTLLFAALMLLGMTNCKKKIVEPIAQPTNGNKVAITLNVGGGAKAEVDPPHVNFETGDQVLVASNGHYVGTLTGTKVGANITFSGDITDPVVGVPLYFYFLGNKDTGTLTAGTSGSTSCTVNISDQANYPHLPVISMGVSIDREHGNAIVNYSSDNHVYACQFHNKASLMKFVVTTDSDAAICVTGMNNKVMVDFSKAANDAQNNGFTYGKVNTDGIITLQGGSGTNVEKWAIVLPTETATPAGEEGSIYTYDGYKGSRPAISNPIAANQYLADGISMTVNTVDMKYSALTFEAKTAGATVTFTKGSSFTGSVQYSTNGGNTWTDYSSAITLSSVGNKVMFRGNNSAYYSGSASKFSGSGDCYIYGNIMSLVSSTGYPTATSAGSYAFREMFKGNSLLKSHATKNLILSATTIGGNCYQYMFQNCTGLTTPPLMLATSATGGNNCNGMFNGCTALTSLPELHLTNLGNYCFQGAFSGCTSLTSVPEDYLPFTTLTPACYMNMFQGCTGLTNVPNLPATTLQPRCYYNMFNGCTSLTALPSNLLPATTLADVQDSKGCYEGMFMGCTGLTSVPNLPATVLKDRCYVNMFNGCTSLTTLPSNLLPATTLAVSCYTNMFQNCSKLSSVPNLPAETLTNNCYTNMFRSTGLTEVPANMLSATTMAYQSCASMFRTCPNLTNTPEIFATTLAEACCDAMFYQSPKVASARPLHATTLVKDCYKNLFSGCKALTSVTCYATDISASGCTTNWLYDVAASGTLTTPSSTAWVNNNVSGVPTGWTKNPLK